ncbi:MAG TPA: cobalamin-binding protein, partial [Longimicrobiaceae bacterium]|nr:cobalamin-binding protein [Longimicrobiaceae bacterium]
MSSAIWIRRARGALLPLLTVLLAACGGGDDAARTSSAAPADSAVAVVDDAGRTVRLPRPARRVVSLIPSATETLLAIGAGDRLVGRTDFDKGPGLDSLPSVGGGMDPSLEAVLALRPELVLSWGRRGDARVRTRLEELGVPVFTVDVNDTADVFRTMRNLGVLTGRERAADSLATALRGELAEVRASVAGRSEPSVFFLVWNDPPMTAGPGTFISQLLGVAGGRNVFADVSADWPNVSLEEIVRRQPDYLVLPQGEKGGAHDVSRLRTAPGWRELRAMREGRVVTIPADLMNRPGPRLGEAARRLRDGLHPGA